MDENDLSTLPGAEATPPPVAEKVDEPVQTEGVVDASPDPTKLRSEIDQLESRRKKAEEDAIYWRKQKAEARADYFRGREGPPQEPVPSSGVGPEPKPTDFEDYDKFVVALTDHRVKLARVQWEQDIQRKTQEQSQKERAENLQAKLQEGFNKYPDFEEVAFDRTASHITPMVVDILAECDHPADIAYYLAKNRVEGVAISRMTPIKASREIAKIEAKLAAAPAPSPRRETKPTTSAPPPINPLAGGTGGIIKDPEKMTQKEYEQWRASQGARRY
jgi:hypothetical protein